MKTKTQKTPAEQTTKIIVSKNQLGGGARYMRRFVGEAKPTPTRFVAVENVECVHVLDVDLKMDYDVEIDLGCGVVVVGTKIDMLIPEDVVEVVFPRNKYGFYEVDAKTHVRSDSELRTLTKLFFTPDAIYAVL